MSRFSKLFLAFALLAAGFMAGRYAERFIYEDICLDLGGGRNPGNHPICVLPEPR